MLLCSMNFLFWQATNGRMTPQALNKFLSEFLITVRKKEHNEEYESNSLRTFLASFQSHSKKKYTIDFVLWKTSSSSKLGERFSQSKGI